MLLSSCYEPPKCITENLIDYLTLIVQRAQNKKKFYKRFIIKDVNLNCLNYNEDNNIKHFYHKLFQLGFIPLIDEHTIVCKNSATIIGNILTNCVFDNTLKRAVIKSDISDHFPIIFTIQTGRNQSKYRTLVYYKRDFNEANKAAFKQQVSLLNWRHISTQKDVNKMYGTFLSTFSEIYELIFHTNKLL